MLKAFITYFLPWLLSLITIVSTLMAGNKHPKAWLLSALNQPLWFIWIVVTGTWGLLPMNLVLAAIFWRNHLKWRPNEGTTPAQRAGLEAALSAIRARDYRKPGPFYKVD